MNQKVGIVVTVLIGMSLARQPPHRLHRLWLILTAATVEMALVKGPRCRVD